MTWRPIGMTDWGENSLNIVVMQHMTKERLRVFLDELRAETIK